MNSTQTTILPKQPRELYLLSFGEAWGRFVYYGTQAIIALYLVRIFQFSDNKSYTLFGAYAMFAFALPVLGGYLADRLLGYRHAIILGSVLIILGNILLAMPHYYFFCLGLAISVMGTGFYKANATSLVGSLYQSSNSARERGYTIFYMGMNIGGTLGPIFYALFAREVDWSGAFIIAAVGILSSLLLFLKYYRVPMPFKGRCPKWFYPALLVFALLFSFIFYYSIVLDGFIIVIAAIVAIVLIKMMLNREGLERRHLLALLLFSIFGLCFFAASMQVASSVSLFISRDVDHTIFGWLIPTVMFSSLYPLAVIVMAPFITILWGVLAKRNMDPAVPTKLALGLLLAAIGFVCFNYAARAGGHHLQHITLVWILLGNLFLGTGELSLSPSVFAAISRLAPKNLKATMMGVWFLFIAFGCYVSGYFAKLSDQTQITVAIPMNRVLSTSIYAHEFSVIAVFLVIVTLFALFATPWIKRLMQGC